MSEAPIIRSAVAADIAQIQAIYAHYVLNGLASFELEPPEQAEMESRWQLICQRQHPYLVAEVGGRIGGYAYASTYRQRPAYNYTLENSVYVSPDFLKRGLGRNLLMALIETCTEFGARQMIAVIGDSANHASINLHAKCGFEKVGMLPAVGFKHGRWVDSVIMQRGLGDADGTSP